MNSPATGVVCEAIWHTTTGFTKQEMADDGVGLKYTVRGWWGYWFYSHMSPLFRLGWSRELEQSDLGRMPPSARSSCTLPKWHEFWGVELLLPASKRSLLRPMRRALWTWKTAFVSLVQVVFAGGAPFANPLILKALTQYKIGLLDLSVVQKWILVALTFFIPFVANLMTAYASGTFDLIAVSVRNMLSAAIYDKLFQLRASQIKTGTVINLLNSDVRHIEHFFVALPAAVFLPVQVAIAVWLLYREIDVSIFAGFGYQVCTLPFLLICMMNFGRLFQEKQKLTDSRLKLVNEVLNGIRIVKYYCWEQAFEGMVQTVRLQELAKIKTVGYIFAVVETLMKSATVILPVVIFYTYLRLDQALTPDKPFVVLTYVGILAAGVQGIPGLLNYYIQTATAASRIVALLNEPSLKKYVQSSVPVPSDLEGLAVVLRMATLSWDNSGKDKDKNEDKNEDGRENEKKREKTKDSAATATYESVGQQESAPSDSGANSEKRDDDDDAAAAAFSLRDVSLSLRKGQLLGVVGSVGSGKSSLLLSMLDELELVSGSVAVVGTVAYHSQSCWILNATIQENVTFGAPYNPEWFNAVLKLSALDADLSNVQTFPAGQLTEIGEKGINLSGGQKARVSFARALYRRADVLLLDDPLSAVDAHVGTHLFASIKQQCREGRCVVLVTHQIQFLPDCDCVLVLENGCVKASGSYEALHATGVNLAAVVAPEANDEEKEQEEEEEEVEEEEAETENENVNEDGGDGEKGAQDENRVAGVAEPKQRSRSSSSIGGPARARGSSQSSSSKTSPRARSSTLGVSNKDKSNGQGSAKEKQDKDKDGKGAGNADSLALMSEEERSSGRVSADVYRWYMQRFSYEMLLGLIVTSIGGAVAASASTFVLDEWSKAQIVALFTTGSKLDMDSQLYYIGRYAWLNCITIATSYVGSLFMVFGIYRFGCHSHKQLVRSILAAPIAFFDTTPLGRILNRFSKDIDQTDINTGLLLSMASACFAQLVVNVGTMAYTTKGTILCLVVPMSVVFFFIQKFYQSTNLHLKRINSIANSPVNAAVTTVLSGLTSLRSYSVESLFAERYSTAVEAESTSHLLLSYGNQWIQCRIGLLGASCSFFIFCLSIAAENSFIPPGEMGIALTNAFNLPFLLGMILRASADLEASFNAVERIRHYSEAVEREGEGAGVGAGAGAGAGAEATGGAVVAAVVAATDIELATLDSASAPRLGMPSASPSASLSPSASPSPSLYSRLSVPAARVVADPPESEWPSEGVISATDCVMGYRSGPDILRGLSFAVRPREKVGIVGRTGCGKSSLIVSLFRVEDLRKGAICIDGVDIASLSLPRLRSALTIIPQDPVMFSAPVRFNLDPFARHTDQELWDVLEDVHMKSVVAALEKGLLFEVSEGGANFSAGQRQLICFARALLRRSRIIILDEATANVDGETDELLQQMIRSKFGHCTVLTIAHRLNTIIDSDRIMVLDCGRLAEMDTPEKLMQIPDGIFAGMWREHQQH